VPASSVKACWHQWIRWIRWICNCRCLSLCLSVSNFAQKLQTDLHEIFREGWQWASEQMIKFWWWSRSWIGIRIRIWICIWVRIVTLVRRGLAEVCTVPVLLVYCVPALESQCKGCDVLSSVRTVLVDRERMRPMHDFPWFVSLRWVLFSALTLLVWWRGGRPSWSDYPQSFSFGGPGLTQTRRQVKQSRVIIYSCLCLTVLTAACVVCYFCFVLPVLNKLRHKWQWQSCCFNNK